MGRHRSLNDALNLTPEKIAFINGKDSPDAPASQIDSPTTAALPSSTASSQRQLNSRRSKETQPTNSRLKKRTQDDSNSANSHPQELDLPHHEHYRVPITTRLLPSTADALRKAYLERKIQRRPLATQQEIIEAALQAWLREHAFLTD